jgi:hypothetical protein
MTVTGFVDFITLNNIDKNYMQEDIYGPITKWVVEKTKPSDVFLTNEYVLHPILLAGRKIFYGHSYYAWSAGYNTNQRQAVVGKIYNGTSIGNIKKLLKNNNIKYIVLDQYNKPQNYGINEKLIRDNFTKVVDFDKEGVEIFEVD